MGKKDRTLTFSTRHPLGKPDKILAREVVGSFRRLPGGSPADKGHSGIVRGG